MTNKDSLDAAKLEIEAFGPAGKALVAGGLAKPEEPKQSSATKPLPLVKIKRYGKYGGYRVYKLVGGEYKVKRTFFTLHQANRYVKGWKE